MIYLLMIYLLFQVMYDHWAQDNAAWWAAFYLVQWGTIAGVCLIEFTRTKLTYFMFLSIPFIGLALDEIIRMTEYNGTPFVMASQPVYNMTIFVFIIFIIYELWKKRRALASRGRMS